MGDYDPILPWIATLYGDLNAIPTMLIYAGVDAVLRNRERLFHCFAACVPIFREARLVMADICAFIELFERMKSLL